MLSNSEEAGEREWRKVASQIMVIHSYNKGEVWETKIILLQLEEQSKNKSSVYIINPTRQSLKSQNIHDPLLVLVYTEELVQMCVEVVQQFITLFSMKAWCKVWYCCLQSISERTVHWGELLVVPTTELLTFNFNFLQWRNCVDCGAVMIILYFLPQMKTTKTTHNHQSSLIPMLLHSDYWPKCFLTAFSINHICLKGLYKGGIDA